MTFTTTGYEDLELSTQILIKEAFRRGIDVEVLDRKDNFIRLKRNSKTELVKQATRTSADTYISALVMENKAVTKKLLHEKGISVPRGGIFHSMEDALASYNEYAGAEIVVKPNSTNFGEGVSVITENSEDLFRQALAVAFSFDGSVIIEEFIPGREFRFLVINAKVVAVLHRMAANVKGDGLHSVKELIEIKNRNPLRGEGYTRPLEKIKAGQHEYEFLQEQGKDFGYVPANGETVFLRKNSNISTGGDSMDFTDAVPVEYKEIAVRAAGAVGAKICGADIIIRDITAKPAADSYGIIELNFNPAIHIHSFPLEGENRHAENAVLDLLGFTEDANA